MSVKLPFKTQGFGPDLLILHGYAGRPQSLDLLATQLSPYFRVITPDLNNLYMNRKKMTFSQQVEGMSEWLHSRVSRPHFNVLGLSYGAALGWGLSLAHPELINRLIFVNPMGPHPLQSIRSHPMRFFMRLPSWDPVAFAFLNTSVGRKFLYSAREIFKDTRLETMDLDSLRGKKLKFVAGMISQFSWILEQENWPYWQEKAAENSKQSLLIYDSKDPLFHHDYYELFAEKFGVQEKFKIDGVGHIPQSNHYSLIADSVISFVFREKLARLQA